MLTAATTPPSRRDLAFAGCLALVLAMGVLGVLLLNTSMQQQSDRLEIQRERLASLQLQMQTLRTQLDIASDPARLESRARALHLRPVTKIRYVDANGHGMRRVSAPKQAAARAHEG